MFFPRNTLLLSLLILLLAPSCRDRAPTPAPSASAATASATAPTPTGAPAPARPPERGDLPRSEAFSAERAWRHLQAQVAMGPRAHGAPGHEKLRAYMAAHLEAAGARVRIHEFTHQGAEDDAPRPFYNVLGRFRPDAERWILLGTHYDTRLWADEDPDPSVRNRPIEGANDGGSGTAVLLEIATVLQAIPPVIGVEIAFFDGEDYGRHGRFEDYFLGSTALARDWEATYGASRPECAVILDMVGDADLAFRRETKSQDASPWVNDLLWGTGIELGVKAFGHAGQSPIYDDQDAFLAMGIPAALIIDYEYPWWHTQGDTLDKCSPRSLGETGRVVLAAVVDRPVIAPARAAGGAPSPLATPAAPPDSAAPMPSKSTAPVR